MLDKDKETTKDLKVSAAVKSSGATKRKAEDSTTDQQDAKVRKIESVNTTPSSRATSGGDNTKQASTSVTVDHTKAVPSEIVASVDDADKWSCASCTFRNHPALDACEVCATSRTAFESLKLQLEDMKRRTSFVQPPSLWLPVDPGTRMRRVKINENDKSYLDISERMTSCCELSCVSSFFFPIDACISKSNLQIRKIERIENLGLYQMYSIKKSQIEQENGSAVKNERMLWHGTSSECVDNIASYGFNRSHCGKNGSWYGKGVYFSRSPCYSANPYFAKPNSYGLRYMFYCRVLTGRHTLGDDTMVEPPLLHDKLGRFNSLSNKSHHPDMFVIFHDAQAYPEFLITFKCD